MDKNKENVPKIRFPRFEGPWEQCELGELLEICTKKNGTMFTKEDVLSVSDKFGCINQIRFQGRSFAGEDISNYKVVREGNIIYTRSPLQAKPYGIIKIVSKETGVVSPLYVVNTIINGNDATFIYYLFDTPNKTNTYLGPLVRKGAKNTMNISNEEWLSGEVIISPIYEEQKKIGEFFKQFDNLITLHKRKLNHLKDKKRGLLQKMLPKEGEKFSELRFPGFIEPWEQRKVMDTAPLQRGFDLPKGEMKVGPYPVIMSNGINGYHSEYKVKGPGVVTGRSGTIGNLHYTECNYWPHNTALWVTDFKCNYPRYIYYMYQRLNLNRFGTGSGVPTLNRNDVHSEMISLPKHEEQRQIADFLTNLDNLITLHQRKLNHLQQQKKGLLQQMFI